MIDETIDEARHLVAEVRAAAAAHLQTWEELVPDQFTINLAAEDAEEAAYADMAESKTALRKHICSTYGLSIRELCSLAAP